MPRIPISATSAEAVESSVEEFAACPVSQRTPAGTTVQRAMLLQWRSSLHLLSSSFLAAFAFPAEVAEAPATL